MLKPDSHEEGKAQDSAPQSGQLKPKKSLLRRAMNLLAFAALLCMVALAAYGLSGFYARYLGSGIMETEPSKAPVAEDTAKLSNRPDTIAETMMLTLYFPVEGRLYKEQRGVPRPSTVRDIAAMTVGEFMAGPSARESTLIPKDGRLLGAYYGTDGMLYLDFSDPFRHGFQGGVRQEYLLLKAIRESVMANVYKVRGIKLLVEGSEVDTFGGHLSMRGTLAEALRYPFEVGEAGGEAPEAAGAIKAGDEAR